MAHLITGRSGADVYHQVLRRIDHLGRPRTSRDGDVVELTDVTIALDGPDHALPLHCGRNLNLRIAAAEALQLIGGFSDPARMCEIAPQFRRYREDLSLGRVPWFHGAYGPRIASHGQLDTVVRRLLVAPDTRQAVVTLWDPEVDTEEGHLDYPCTVALGFGVTELPGDPEATPRSLLNMRVTMRSNDAWLGLPYDVFQFTQLQYTLAGVLGVDVGSYTHNAWSLHLYDRDHDKIHNVTTPNDYQDNYPRGIGLSPTSLLHVRATARWLWDNDVPDYLSPTLTTSERWYLDILHGTTSQPAPATQLARDTDRDGREDSPTQPVQP